MDAAAGTRGVGRIRPEPPPPALYRPAAPRGPGRLGRPGRPSRARRPRARRPPDRPRSLLGQPARLRRPGPAARPAAPARGGARRRGAGPRDPATRRAAHDGRDARGRLRLRGDRGLGVERAPRPPGADLLPALPGLRVAPRALPSLRLGRDGARLWPALL